MYRLMLKSFFKYDKNKFRYFLLFITIFFFLMSSLFIYYYLNNKINTITESPDNRRIIIDYNFDESNPDLLKNINEILENNKEKIENIEYVVSSNVVINGKEYELTSMANDDKNYFKREKIISLPRSISKKDIKNQNIEIVYSDDEVIRVNNALAKVIIETQKPDYWQINITVKNTNVLTKLLSEFAMQNIDVLHNIENKLEYSTYTKIRHVVITVFSLEVCSATFMIYIVVRDILKKQQTNIFVLKNIGYNKINVLSLLEIELFIIINFSFGFCLLCQTIITIIFHSFFTEFYLPLISELLLFFLIHLITLILIIIRGIKL